MTLILPFGDGHSKDESLAVAEELFTEAGTLLGQKLLELKRGEYEAKDLKAAVNDLTVAWQTALKERSRVVDERRKERGVVGAYAIDIGRARSEIGRRLARLRTDSDGR